MKNKKNEYTENKLFRITLHADNTSEIKIISNNNSLTHSRIEAILLIQLTQKANTTLVGR